MKVLVFSLLLTATAITGLPTDLSNNNRLKKPFSNISTLVFLHPIYYREGVRVYTVALDFTQILANFGKLGLWKHPTKTIIPCFV
jgi:hypothetical protein